MSARAWFRRVIGAVPLAALLLGIAAPVASSAHCRGAAGHHGMPDAMPHEHHSNSNPAPSPGECPHCPPAACGAQTACAAPVLGVFEPARVRPATLSGPGIPSRPVAVVRHPALKPPTPPPQISVALV